jgi:hypothetical protein
MSEKTIYTGHLRHVISVFERGKERYATVPTHLNPSTYCPSKYKESACVLGRTSVQLPKHVRHDNLRDRRALEAKGLHPLEVERSLELDRWTRARGLPEDDYAAYLAANADEIVNYWAYRIVFANIAGLHRLLHEAFFNRNLPEDIARLADALGPNGLNLPHVIYKKLPFYEVAMLDAGQVHKEARQRALWEAYSCGALQVREGDLLMRY